MSQKTDTAGNAHRTRTPKTTISDQWGDFVTIPKQFTLASKNLSDQARWLFVLLREYTNGESGKAFPSYKTIQDRTGWTPKTISKALKDLENHGWLDREYQFGGVTLYTLVKPSNTTLQEVPHNTSQRDAQYFPEGSPILPVGTPIKNETNKNEINKIETIENSQANFHDNNDHIEPKPPLNESVDIGVNVSSETTPPMNHAPAPPEKAKLSLVSDLKPKREGKGRQKQLDPPFDPVSASTQAPTATPHKQMSDALHAFGQTILNWNAQGKAIKRILDGGYTAEQAIECLNWLADPKSGWPGRADWLIVQSQIADYFRRKASKLQQPVKESTVYEQPRTESPRFAPATLNYLAKIGYGIEEAS